MANLNALSFFFLSYYNFYSLYKNFHDLYDFEHFLKSVLLTLIYQFWPYLYFYIITVQ